MNIISNLFFRYWNDFWRTLDWLVNFSEGFRTYSGKREVGKLETEISVGAVNVFFDK